MGTFGAPKISKLGIMVDNFKWNNFPFWPNLKIPLYCKLKILETKAI
jgi:hypothetical protein